MLAVSTGKVHRRRVEIYVLDLPVFFSPNLLTSSIPGRTSTEVFHLLEILYDSPMPPPNKKVEGYPLTL